jgi:hypothetical protein
MRCPNCNDVKKKSDQDDILCDYCYEASFSDRAFVFDGEQKRGFGQLVSYGNYNTISPLNGVKFLQKRSAQIDNGIPAGTVVMWDGKHEVPDGFEDVGYSPNFAGQNSDFRHIWSNGVTMPYAQLGGSNNF